MGNYNLHRNSQKRIYVENYPYFITTNTYRRYPYFKEKIFCNLFINCLEICKELKKFKLYGFVILTDHVHLIVKPGKEYNISKIMKSLKENFSRDANIMMTMTAEGATTSSRLREMQKTFQSKKGENNYSRLHGVGFAGCSNEGEVGQPRLRTQGMDQIDEFVLKSRKTFQNKYSKYKFPKFQWQKSYFDHIIRDQKDLEGRLKYIWRNPEKHNISKNFRDYPYLSYNNYQNLIDRIE